MGLAAQLERVALEQVLDLDGNPLGDAGAASLPALGSNAALRVLSVQDCKIGDAGAAGIREALRAILGLRELAVYDNPLGATLR